LIKVVVLLFALSAFPIAAHAGTTGMITGMVRDSNGVPVAGVRVTVTAPSDRETVTTDACGNFSFLRLPPDAYTIAMEKSGFEPVSYVGVTVFADISLALTFRLEHLRIIGREHHWYNGRLVNHVLGADEMNVSAQHYEAYANGVPLMLTTVPGVVVGSGGSYIH
jgi:hypothetical protein